jgi:molybdenum cofactor cytidylyltransferase
LIAPAEIVAVVLAAGRSMRFGGDKLLHTYRGKPLAAHIAETLAAMPYGHRIAVCPAGDDERSAVFVSCGFGILANDDPAAGMGRSLALAARAAMGRSATALLVCLADMPHVTADHLRALIAAGDAADAVATEADGTRGPPAIFRSTLFPRLGSLAGDSGARELIRSAAVVTTSPHIVRDYDTPEDFD